MRLRALFSRNQAAFSVRVLGAKVETDATGHIFTNTSCIVTKVLAEVAPSTPPLQPNLELVVRTLGGRVENVTQFASHQPQLLAGAEYLLVTSALDRTTITGIADFQTLRISENSTSWMGVTVPSEDITDALSLLGTEYP